MLLVTLQSAQQDPKPYWTTIINIRETHVSAWDSSGLPINIALVFWNAVDVPGGMWLKNWVCCLSKGARQLVILPSIL